MGGAVPESPDGRQLLIENGKADKSVQGGKTKVNITHESVGIGAT